MEPSYKTVILLSSYRLRNVIKMILFQELGLRNISKNGVILVSFGSLTMGKQIPVELIRVFLSVFRTLPHSIVWQFGSEFDTKGEFVPENVHLYKWIPQLRNILGE